MVANFSVSCDSFSIWIKMSLWLTGALADGCFQIPSNPNLIFKLITLCSLCKTTTSSIRATVTLIALHYGENNTTE